MSALLDVQDMVTVFRTEAGILKAVDGVSFALDRGEKLGLIGESGCGKSVTALSILRLIQDPPGRIMSGRIIFDGKNLLEIPLSEMRNIRGNRISMIFQEPMSSLNPVYTVGNQIGEAVRLHQKLGRAQTRSRTLEMLRKVGIPDPEQRINEYPHQLSGGMCQRVMIAMALSCNPEVLIADEPSTALDVTIQAQILDLINQLVSELRMSLILITHDLGVIAETAERVIVMYAGKVMEEAGVGELFKNPLHPYTRGLLASLPGPRGEKVEGKRARLKAIPGLVPSPLDLPPGCPFQERCPLVKPPCREAVPEILEKRPGHQVRCFEVR
jgi:oligopeptide/dipeptide ABC transporter ATP-binding protein